MEPVDTGKAWTVPETSESHGQSGGTSTILGLDNLITAELNACSRKSIAATRQETQWEETQRKVRTVDKSVIAVSGDLEVGGDLAEEGNNGLARVTTDDGNGSLGGVGQTRKLLGEGLGANDIQSGDTEQALGVEDASSLEDLGGNRDGRVDGVGDDQSEGVGAELGDTLGQVTDNASVDLEEVVTGHAGLT